MIQKTYDTLNKIPANNYKKFITKTLTYIPDETKSIILFNTQGWSEGRTLPAFYWYLHFENNKRPIHINTGFLRSHLSDFENDLYWIAEKSTLSDLDNMADIYPYEILHEQDPFVLIRIIK